MISSIEINELNDVLKKYIKIDFTNKKLVQIKENNIIEKDIKSIDFDELSNLIKKYLVYWDNTYIDNKIIGGKMAEIILNADNEVIYFSFKNKFPNDYNIFIERLNELVGIYE